MLRENDWDFVLAVERSVGFGFLLKLLLVLLRTVCLGQHPVFLSSLSFVYFILLW